MNTNNQETNWDWAGILTTGFVIFAVGIFAGIVATIGVSSRRNSTSSENIVENNLENTYLSYGAVEARWEKYVTPILPEKSTETDVDVLGLAYDIDGRIVYLVARFDSNNPLPVNTHFYLVNVNVVDIYTVDVEYVGEITGRFLYFSRDKQCWVEIPYSQQMEVAEGCVPE